MKRINEKELQKSLHSLISDPSRILKSDTGKRLQILSPGTLNLFEGPDFRDAAILIEGIVRVGDIEFHRKSSEWDSHGHSADENYNNVILHIVCENNKNLNKGFETLIIPETDILNNISFEEKNDSSADAVTLEELQHYALVRLLRKTSEAQKVLNQNHLMNTLAILTNDYIKKYNAKRRRPSYTDERLEKISESIPDSEIRSVIDNIYNGVSLSIPDIMAKIIKTKIYDEGPHLRREIILNSVLPLMLCIADEKSRIDLFLWYWSTSSLNQYGVLKRKFPDIPQNYIWQQQGMLEYIRMYGRKKNIVSESVQNYGFAQILSFYKLGNAPFHTTDIEK